MTEAFLVMIVLGIGVAALAQAARNPAVRGGFVLRSLAAIAAYAAWCGLGLLVLWGLASYGDSPGGAAVVFVAWVAEGGLWLARKAPRLKALPKWIGERVGWPDLLLIGVAAMGAAVGLVRA